MSSTLIIGLEVALVFGSVLALAVWEVVRLRRERRRDEKQEVERRDRERRA